MKLEERTADETDYGRELGRIVKGLKLKNESFGIAGTPRSKKCLKKIATRICHLQVVRKLSLSALCAQNIYLRKVT
jgi:hypothetical protein